MKHLRKAATTWIDDLGNSMEQLFSEEELNEITTGEGVQRSYIIVALENAQHGAKAYENYLVTKNVYINPDYDQEEIRDKDNVDNCWSTPPRSVYSKFNTLTTITDTTSDITTPTTDSIMSVIEAMVKKRPLQSKTTVKKKKCS
eukprot:5511105-Ditylum_brightwellii.AAC.1